MIGATVMRLGEAAEMLNTDEDTLLIAAYEGSIRLLGLLAEHREAELVRVTEDPFDEANGTVVGTRKRFFGFVPIPHREALVLLKGDEAEIETLTDERALYREMPFDWNLLPQWGQSRDNGYWRDAETGIAPPLKVSRGNIFAPSENVLEILREGKVPSPGTVPDAPMLPRKVPRDNNLIITIAALLSVWPGGTIPSSKDLEKAAQSLGLALSDDTIRKALKAAQEVAPSLPLPK